MDSRVPFKKYSVRYGIKGPEVSGEAARTYAEIQAKILRQAMQTDHEEDSEQIELDIGPTTTWIPSRYIPDPVTASGTSITLPRGTKIDTETLKRFEGHKVFVGDEEIDTSSPCPVIDYKRMKEEGRCQHCTELLPMNAFGLGDCKRCNP